MDTLARPVARAPRTSLWLLRAVLTAHLAAVLLQPVLAGLFLTGDVDAIEVHGLLGSLLALLGLISVGATLAYVVGGRGRIRILPVAVVLFVADVLQIGFGYARQLALHVPLGVAIVTASVLLVVWAWSPAARAAR